MEINTFDIVRVDFGDVVFAGEQGGIRPAVVIQNAYGNIYSDTTIVIPFTSKIKHLQQPTHSDNVKQITQSEVENNTEKVMVAENIQKWINKITDLNGLATDALHRKEELCEELSFIDRELSDINHYIEFCNLNAAQGWKAYKMIKERRIKRRSIKNEIQILNIILDKKISDTVTNEILESMSKMDKRTYEPRVMNELFDL